MRLPSSPRHAEDDEPHPAAAPTSSRHTRRLLRNRRGLDIQANEGNAAGAPAKLPQGQLLIWSGANSVAWGARFLGPSRDASATSSSSSSSSSQQPNQNQDPTINTAAAVASSSSASEWNNSSSLFIGVIVALIICFYLLCTYQCLRIWLCRKFFGREVGLARVGGTSGTLSTSHHGDSSNNNNSNNANTVLVHEGRVFNLSGDQRRQVLEVIFSESSKPATDLDVAKMKKKRRKKHGGMASDQQLGSGSFDDDDDEAELGDGVRDANAHDRDGVPLNVQIPGVSTARTEESGTEDGTATAASSSPASAGRSPATTVDFDGDTSITSTNEDINMDADENTEYFDSSALPSSLGLDNTARSGLVPETAPVTSPSLCDDEGLPRTPPRIHSRSEHLGTTTNESGETTTPRASSHLSPSRSQPMASTRPMSTGSLPDLAEASGNLGNSNQYPSSSAIGDDTAILKTMVPLSPLRTISKSKSFVIPEDEAIEDGKREITSECSGGGGGGGGDDDGDAPPKANDGSSLHIPIPLIKRGSFASATSEYTYDDGSTITGDNVCPICLSGFKIGDLLVTSKYCSHVFHRECILEWLDKNDNCPVCRVDMVTESEINQAATTLVGKTRMVRAVASLQSSSHRRSPPSASSSSSSPPRPANATSPLQGTVRRRAYNSNYY